MSKFYRMAAAIAMFGLVMACLTPAATVVPTATNAPAPATVAAATTAPASNNVTPLTPKEKAATRIAKATQNAQPGQSVQSTASVPFTSGQDPQGQYGLVKDKIKHVIIIMQENRSFDEYFGTYPGADGIPMQNGVPTVCANDPKTNTCVKPYHNAADVNAGGPHAAASATADIDSGKMDGFINSFRERAESLQESGYTWLCRRTDAGCDGLA